MNLFTDWFIQLYNIENVMTRETNSITTNKQISETQLKPKRYLEPILN